MRYAFLLALFLPVAVSAQSGTRGRGGSPGDGLQGTFGVPATPETVVAPDVPVLQGLPHAVKVGYTVYVSGMVPLDSAGQLVGVGDLAAQARQVVRNLGSVMRASRGTPGDVVRVTVYLRNVSPERVAVVRDAILDGLDRATPPAMTVVGINALVDAGFELTVEATGQLRSEFPDRSRVRKP